MQGPLNERHTCPRTGNCCQDQQNAASGCEYRRPARVSQSKSSRFGSPETWCASQAKNGVFGDFAVYMALIEPVGGCQGLVTGDIDHAWKALGAPVERDILRRLRGAVDPERVLPAATQGRAVAAGLQGRTRPRLRLGLQRLRLPLSRRLISLGSARRPNG